MKTIDLFLLGASLVLLSACGKDNNDPVAPIPTAATCGLDGARLQASFDGASFCPNASLFASEGAGTVTISGITQLGVTLTLELDSLSVGPHSMSESTNAILYTSQFAIAYQSTDGNPGTVNITSHDMAAQRIRGNFSATLYTQVGGAPKGITGDFDMFYVE